MAGSLCSCFKQVLLDPSRGFRKERRQEADLELDSSSFGETMVYTTSGGLCIALHDDSGRGAQHGARMQRNRLEKV
eukprot:CAMPEP_0194764644 /NCGR_PEP_ID=MMETSP0323_2-20130528/23575_1 /TAXON_ID=2866 ORGANISM="Crypthecodinium cohnii, Strain Seligo" /NCGR_SAMPLE_ID=MMETSP0323_2 /ASSEMBLY_ACC=CAM_ASM_000346 /LENGTH=75 /DNA_ID=CAMNT_0039692355 /DNA_START=28 /DNA_END=251 /DNA_ORIENTATION=+